MPNDNGLKIEEVFLFGGRLFPSLKFRINSSLTSRKDHFLQSSFSETQNISPRDHGGPSGRDYVHMQFSCK